MSEAEIKEKLGRRVREIRTEQGLTQHAIAEKCGFTYSYIGGLERAEKNITLLNLYKVAQALDVGIYQFFLHSDNYDDLPADKLFIQEIVTMLDGHDPKTIEVAKDVLDALLKHMK